MATELETTIKYLKRIDACSDALDWLKTLPSETPVQTAWDTCEHGGWMLWLIGKTTKSEPWSEERKPLVRVELELARLAWKWMPVAGRECIELYEQWCSGEDIPQERLIEARRSACADPHAAYASYAYIYAYVASGTSAYAVTYAAAYARKQTLAQCANITRKHFPVCPLVVK